MICLLMMGTAACEQEETADSAEEQTKAFATVEEGIAYYLDDGEEVLWQDRVCDTEFALLYSAETEGISALAFAEQPEGYVEQWGLASYGSGVHLSVDAPWETEGKTPYPHYEISYTAFDTLPAKEELEADGFCEYIERNGRYFSVKLERYEMQPVLTNEVQIS